MAGALATRQANDDTGKLNRYHKLSILPPIPSKCFFPEPEGLFGRIKSDDTRNGWEAEVLWNIRHNCENALASSRKVAEALAVNDVAGATNALSVLYDYLNASYESLQELLEFFADTLDSGKLEAIILQKYLREDDKPYASQLYRTTKSKFAELCSHAYAKEFNKQSASSGARGGNYNNRNRGGSSSGNCNSNHKANKNSSDDNNGK